MKDSPYICNNVISTTKSTTPETSMAATKRTLGTPTKATTQKTASKATTQTTTLAGRRVILTTSASGKVTIKDAPVLEWVLQAEQVRQLKAMPEFGKQFLILGGMEAGRRGKQEQMKAKATGLTAGHPDLTVFLPGARIAMIENKAEKGRLSAEQVERHAALKQLGHVVELVRASTQDEAAAKAVGLVRGWLAAPVAANDNDRPSSQVAEKDQ